MPTKVMIGLKPGSDPAQLIDLATSLSRPPVTIHLASLVNVGAEGDERERLEHVEQQLEQTAAGLRDAGYETSCHAQINATSAGSGLARLAERHEIDLLVIGLAKRSRVGKALLGSDAQTTILTAPCPVACIRLS